MCCASSRENTVDCPLDCRHLADAHLHERLPDPDPEAYPHKDVEITERFAEDTAPLFTFFGHALSGIAAASPGLRDSDVREALEAMSRTYRTLESGLVYETRPSNPLAAGIQQRLAEELDALRARLRERAGMETLRDSDIFGVLVMFQRVAYGHDNGRPRGRAFLSFLRREFPAAPPPATAPPAGGLILP